MGPEYGSQQTEPGVLTRRLRWMLAVVAGAAVLFSMAAGCSTNTDTPGESVAQARDDEPGHEEQGAHAKPSTCVVELEWPDIEATPGDGCHRWPTLTKMANPHVEYPCGGGEGRLEGEMTSRAASLDSVQVEVVDRRLKLEARSSPYIVYGCITNLVERFEGNLDTGIATYRYDDEWSEPEHCQKACPLELEGRLIEP